jgi:hypothetical protein
MKPQEIDAPQKALAQSVAPFKAELSTLAATWQLLLPFGILSRHIAPVEALQKYTITFAKVGSLKGNPLMHHLILVFHRGAIPSSSDSPGLRSILLSDEHGSKAQDHKDFREKRVNVLSTWMWDQNPGTATFWLSMDEMQRMKDEEG